MVMDRSIEKNEQQQVVDVMKDIVSERKNKISEKQVNDMKYKAYTDLKAKRALDFTNLDRSIDIEEVAEPVQSSGQLPTLMSQKNSCMKTVKQLQVLCSQERIGSLMSKKSLGIVYNGSNNASPKNSVNSSAQFSSSKQNGKHLLAKAGSLANLNKINFDMGVEDSPGGKLHFATNHFLNESLPYLDGRRGYLSIDKTGISDNNSRGSSRALLPTEIQETNIFDKYQRKAIVKQLEPKEDDQTRLTTRPPSQIRAIKNPGLYMPPTLKFESRLDNPFPRLARKLPRRIKVKQSAFNDFYAVTGVPALRVFRIAGKTVLAMVRWMRCTTQAEKDCMLRWKTWTKKFDEKRKDEETNIEKRFKKLEEIMQERADRKERIRRKRNEGKEDIEDPIGDKDSVEELKLELSFDSNQKTDRNQELLLKPSLKTQDPQKKPTPKEARKLTFVEMSEQDSHRKENNYRGVTSIAEIVDVPTSIERVSNRTRLLDSMKGLPTSTSIKRPISMIDFENSFLNDPDVDYRFEQDFFFKKPQLKTMDLRREYKLEEVNLEARFASAKVSENSDVPYTSRWMEIIRDLSMEPTLKDVDDVGYYSFLGLKELGEIRVDSEEHLDLQKIKSRRAFITFYSKVILDLDLDIQVIPGCHDNEFHEHSVSWPDEEDAPYYVQPDDFNKRFFKNLYAPHYKAEKIARESRRTQTYLK